MCGNSSVGRASAFQAEGRGFESRFPLHGDNVRGVSLSWWGEEKGKKQNSARVAQQVEHLHGKQKVIGSNPIVGSKRKKEEECLRRDGDGKA